MDSVDVREAIYYEIKWINDLPSGDGEWSTVEALTQLDNQIGVLRDLLRAAERNAHEMMANSQARRRARREMGYEYGPVVEIKHYPPMTRDDERD